MKPLTPEQQAALDRFKGQHGRRWKAWLRASWSSGVYPTYARENGDHELLGQIKNTLGPSWLRRA